MGGGAGGGGPPTGESLPMVNRGEACCVISCTAASHVCSGLLRERGGGAVSSQLTNI